MHGNFFIEMSEYLFKFFDAKNVKNENEVKIEVLSMMYELKFLSMFDSISKIFACGAEEVNFARLRRSIFPQSTPTAPKSEKKY